MSDPQLSHRASRAWIAYLRVQEKNETLDRKNEILQTQNEELIHENLKVRWHLQALARLPEEERVEVRLGGLDDRRAVEGSWPRAQSRRSRRLKTEVERIAEHVGELSGRFAAFDVKVALESWKAERKAREKEFEHWMGDV